MLTLRMVLWVLKERGLAVRFNREAGTTSVSGDAANVTADLVTDLKRFKGEIVHLFETEGELPVPSECPAWREFRLHAWKPAMMVPTSVRPFRRWVPYTTGVCGDKTIQMYISVDPRPHGYVKGGGFHATGTGWRWIGEETWRPMPKGVIGG